MNTSIRRILPSVLALLVAAPLATRSALAQVPPDYAPPPGYAQTPPDYTPPPSGYPQVPPDYTPPPPGYTQVPAAQPIADPAQAQQQPAFSQAQLDQMIAPIALYPDPLLSQMFMAATYPLEIVEAARWSQANPSLQGDAAVRAVDAQNWDPSVKSLVAFPQVLGWMSENLEWTQSVGNAFLAQQPQVMATVQNLRARAQAAGNLRSDQRETVSNQSGTIVVQPANPQVVYVPYYDPTVVYGAWWWPAYPPVFWRPWPRFAVSAGFGPGFFWTPGITISAGFFFGGFDWAHHQARVVRVNNFYYHPANREMHASAAPVRAAPGPWQHAPEHRRGVAYHTPALQRQYGALNRPPARESEREHAAPRPEQRDDRDRRGEMSHDRPAQYAQRAPAPSMQRVSAPPSMHASAPTMQHAYAPPPMHTPAPSMQHAYAPRTPAPSMQHAYAPRTPAPSMQHAYAPPPMHASAPPMQHAYASPTQHAYAPMRASASAMGRSYSPAMHASASMHAAHGGGAHRHA
jgi:hypothetical protein